MTKLENGDSKCCQVPFEFMWVGTKSLSDEETKEMIRMQMVAWITNLLRLSKIHLKQNPLYSLLLYESANSYFKCNLENNK